MKTKPLILLGIDMDVTRMIYWALDQKFGVDYVFLENDIPKLDILKRKLKKEGPIAILGQTAFKLFHNFALKPAARGRIQQIIRVNHLKSDPIPDFKITRVDNLNDPSSIDKVRSASAAIGVISGTRILNKKFLEGVGIPLLNLHAGITPAYRGVHGGYWALVEKDQKNFGVTLHIVDPGIDTGQVVGYGRATPTSKDQFSTYPYLQLVEGIKLVHQTLEDLSAESCSDVESFAKSRSGLVGPEASRLWKHPTLVQYLKNRILRNIP